MKMSCSGCRVLRKACSESCTLRPSLEWIHSPEAQANATCFLAKFYGRTGLLNLINAGPDHLRPAIFKSLLYEACGRIINPTFGAIGLLSSSGWHHCEAAVNSVLDGFPLMKVCNDIEALNPIMPLPNHDIRHLSRKSDGLHCAPSTRTVSNQSCVNETMLIESDSEMVLSESSCNNYQGGLIPPNQVPHRSLSDETIETLDNIGDRKSKKGIVSEEIDLELTLGLGHRGGQPPPGFGEKVW